LVNILKVFPGSLDNPVTYHCSISYLQSGPTVLSDLYCVTLMYELTDWIYQIVFHMVWKWVTGLALQTIETLCVILAKG